jgi:hypothetical protein
LQIFASSGILNSINKKDFPMAFLIVALLISIAIGSALMLFVTRLRLLDARVQSQQNLPDVNRYRPMLRLLSENDLEFAASNPKIRSRIRSQRRQVFRGYLRCLTKDYARLLLGIRGMMVEAGEDRPDLAKALARNRAQFALALCRIELNLQLHALGIGRVDVSGLVEALDTLRGAVSVMTPATGAAF